MTAVMPKIKHTLAVLMLFFLINCGEKEPTVKSHQSETLKVEQLTVSTFRHTSWLQTQSFGKVGCNGMIVANSGEAIVYDTPVDSATSIELINWIESTLKSKIIAVVPTHFHSDCLGGLTAFHTRNIPSFANQQTIALADSNGSAIPQNGFEGKYEHRVGNQTVISEFFGAGHTRDNIISYVPKEGVLFGGCLIKSLKAGKGNLADADTTSWPTTVFSIKAKYPNAKTIIPGHGKVGGQDLLDYTENMFKKSDIE